MNQLTTIASLPGSGGGCMSALPAERNIPRRGDVIDAPALTAEARRRIRKDVLLSAGFVYSVSQDAFRNPEGLTVPGVWLLIDDMTFAKNYVELLKSAIKTELTFPKIVFLGEEPEC